MRSAEGAKKAAASAGVSQGTGRVAASAGVSQGTGRVAAHAGVSQEAGETAVSADTLRRAAVLKKGDDLTLVIEDLTDAGEGVGHADGFAFFVKDAVPGDVVEASVMKMKNRYGYAHLDRIIDPSPDRVTPPCPVARACGGCQLQAIAYPAELAWKERRVRQALARIGGIPEERLDAVFLPIAGGESEETSGDGDVKRLPAGGGTGAFPAGCYRYRNKAQFPVAADRSGRPVAGFYAARTHSVVPVDDCLLGDPVFADIRRIVLAHMEQYRIPAYDERTGKGLLRHILIRRGHHSGQIGVTLVVNAAHASRGAEGAETAAGRLGGGGDAMRGQTGIAAEAFPERTAASFARSGEKANEILPGASSLADRLFAAVPGVTSFSLNLNPVRTNVILGRELLPVRGEAVIEDTMCGLRFRISPLSFYQVNTAQAERLYAQAMAFAGLTGAETVIDLYCGIGTITLLAAKRAARAIGVEVIPEAIENARSNAALNEIDNVEFRVGKAEDVLPALLTEGIRADVLIVDPPRAGLAPSCVDAIHTLAPARVIYISCNPATLARDVKLLTGAAQENAEEEAQEQEEQEKQEEQEEQECPKYRLEAARAFDLFPRTGHVETVVSLSLKNDSPKIEVSMKPGADSLYEPKDEGTYL